MIENNPLEQQLFHHPELPNTEFTDTKRLLEICWYLKPLQSSVESFKFICFCGGE